MPLQLTFVGRKAPLLATSRIVFFDFFGESAHSGSLSKIARRPFKEG
jgi:hypothetical protein